jgi:hypothetical protein
VGKVELNSVLRKAYNNPKVCQMGGCKVDSQFDAMPLLKWHNLSKIKSVAK